MADNSEMPEETKNALGTLAGIGVCAVFALAVWGAAYDALTDDSALVDGLHEKNTQELAWLQEDGAKSSFVTSSAGTVGSFQKKQNVVIEGSEDAGPENPCVLETTGYRFGGFVIGDAEFTLTPNCPQ